MIPILFRINTNPDRRKREEYEAPEPNYFYPHDLFKSQTDEEYEAFYASMSRKDKRLMVTSRIIPSVNFHFDMPDIDPFSVVINPNTGLTWGNFSDTVRGLPDDEMKQHLEAAQVGMSEENAKAAMFHVVERLEYYTHCLKQKNEWPRRQNYYYRCIKDVNNELQTGLWPDTVFKFRHGDHILRCFKYKLKGEGLRFWLYQHGVKFSRAAWAVLLDCLRIKIKSVDWIVHVLQDANGESLFSIEGPAECAPVCDGLAQQKDALTGMLELYKGAV